MVEQILIRLYVLTPTTTFVYYAAGYHPGKFYDLVSITPQTYASKFGAFLWKASRCQKTSFSKLNTW
jgi:hypothetical protein